MEMMSTNKAYSAVTFFKEKIYAFGRNGYRDCLDCFDLKEMTWTTVASIDCRYNGGQLESDLFCTRPIEKK
ncbi:kelch repeat protein [Ancylostoma caninum]|uniref:Kelch repeat protein n=1 Tax=Ancylostoma caninum TaxID=29170 RepID=A0A368FLV1_ANCCA|nr:kelch repeat protein [Ancylostoma caninum]